MIWEIDERARTIEGLDADGRPRPEYAASLGLRRAPFGRRVLATVIEAVVLLLIQSPMLIVVVPALSAIALATDPVEALTARDDVVLLIILAAVSSGLSTAFLLTQLILLGRRGVTLGKALTGLRAVNVRTLERPGFWRGAVVRYLVLCASMIVPVLGPLLVIALSPLFDPDRRGRGWPDLAAAVWLVDVKHGLNPYDDKRMRIARKTVATDLLDVKTELPSLATPVASGGAGAYVPLARNKGGVLGAVRSAPGSGIIGETDAAEEEARPGIPTTVAPAPFAAPAPDLSAASPAPAPAPVPAAVAPGAIVAPAAGSAPWTPPPLLEEPAAAAAPPAAPAAPPAPAAAAPAAEPPARPASASSSVVELTLDSGDTIAVSGGGVVLGRAPATGPDDRDVAPVPVVDHTRSISKTHWALLRTDGRVVAVERGSTNGSVLVRGSREQALVPGQPVALRDGDTIRFGDRSAVVAIR
ncbi:RDD family protein [Microbacterium arborescens]|uniref:RDD family protein n=1 Tax=Microbacterium arborescens TaxID=33883 RepID=UPI002784173B|nr:RDD family protein [Microbacterium arborescens]MDQ1215213.1 putative RDD family membrane protein YckC [Microbacterium arborescens]